MRIQERQGWEVLGPPRTDEQNQSAGSVDKIGGKPKKTLLHRKEGAKAKGEVYTDGLAFREVFSWGVCKELNITHVLCPAHRPEIHGPAERWN